ncbi:EVE domain protein [Planctomycetes bacterium Pan216]|uniref:EVE domain protein n=1 Tax=Kolteria novifilia TaxID=2527975 RepID=A0A518B068_9BACT|nr:EVE domain protein [Planctomycetes bacterium Pan216]
MGEPLGMAAKKRYWLMKSEPSDYSIDDLERDGKEPWDGIRNYQARNIMRDEMSIGDEVLFYHSNADPPGVAGIAKVASKAYPDHTAWDKKNKHFDKRSTPENPVWLMVDVEFVEKFPHLVSLPEIKEEEALAEMMVTKRGMRLSVQPVDGAHFRKIRSMGRRKKK